MYPSSRLTIHTVKFSRVKKESGEMSNTTQSGEKSGVIVGTEGDRSDSWKTAIAVTLDKRSLKTELFFNPGPFKHWSKAALFNNAPQTGVPISADFACSTLYG